MTIRINHNRSIALEQSVINYWIWGGGRGRGFNRFYAEATLALGSANMFMVYKATLRKDAEFRLYCIACARQKHIVTCAHGKSIIRVVWLKSFMYLGFVLVGNDPIEPSSGGPRTRDTRIFILSRLSNIQLFNFFTYVQAYLTFCRAHMPFSRVFVLRRLII